MSSQAILHLSTPLNAANQTPALMLARRCGPAPRPLSSGPSPLHRSAPILSPFSLPVRSISHNRAGSGFHRDTAHRKALWRNLLTSLVKTERITTTMAKAKEVKKHADRLVSMAKKNTLAARRNVASILFEQDAVKKLVEEIAPRFQARPGGYTRTLRLGKRKGDNADMMMLEFVDQGYKVPYDPSVRSKRQFPKQPDFEGFPRRPNSVKPLLYPQTGLHQESCPAPRAHQASSRLHSWQFYRKGLTKPAAKAASAPAPAAPAAAAAKPAAAKAPAKPAPAKAK